MALLEEPLRKFYQGNIVTPKVRPSARDVFVTPAKSFGIRQVFGVGGEGGKTGVLRFETPSYFSINQILNNYSSCVPSWFL